ncbi:MAG: basic amino acid ABC transporter substrate-binding protein [Syntrophomonadaceae bacterium]|nr:basic amino acid ABC transporter substrate-binding protein [Syntrophomonadaceae bacterium]
MNRLARLFLSTLLVVALVFPLVGCGGEQSSEKVLKIGTNATFPPFEFQQSNEFTGFDIDLINAIAEEQGYQVEINHMDFKALIPGLQNDKIDGAIAAMTINAERLESVDFTTPYFDAGLIIAVGQDNDTILSTEDLKGKKLAAQNGTTGARYCNSVKEQDPATDVRIFDDIGLAFMELEKAGVDAVVNDLPVTSYYLATTENTKLKTVGEVFSTEEQYGIAVKKGNTEMLDMFNEGLEKVKANGKYDELYDKWF